MKPVKSINTSLTVPTYHFHCISHFLIHSFIHSFSNICSNNSILKSILAALPLLELLFCYVAFDECIKIIKRRYCVALCNRSGVQVVNVIFLQPYFTVWTYRLLKFKHSLLERIVVIHILWLITDHACVYVYIMMSYGLISKLATKFRTFVLIIAFTLGLIC